MTRHKDLDPECHDGAAEVDTLIVPRARDLGDFEVRRLLPSKDRQMVGPFIFFDQFGPTTLGPQSNMDVRPHPHIGLGTVTYLYEGRIRHRDSVGSVQDIEPGAVNWMIAGRGITHSERRPDDLRGQEKPLSGIQTWMALPAAHEEMAPSFEHHGVAALPVLEGDGVWARIILGHAFGKRAPTTVLSDTLYVDLRLAPGARVDVPAEHEDRAVYVVEGALSAGGQVVPAGTSAVFGKSGPVTLVAGEGGATALLYGGDVADGPRHIWWNFVATSQDRIEVAKEAWKRGDWDEGMFRLPPGDDQEFIPIV